MSISDNYTPDKSLGDGSTVEFSGTWKVLNADYFRLYLEDVDTGVQTLQTRGSDYTLTFDNDGYVATMAVAPTSDNYVVRAREVTQDQQTPYRTAKGFQGENIEASFDKVTALIQDQQDALNRTLKFQLGVSGISNPVLPSPTDGYGIVWDGTTGKVRNTTASLASLEGDAETVADNIASVNAVAAIDADVTTVAGISANVTTVAGIAANVTTVAGISANVTTVSGISANVTTVSGDSADIQILAPVSADIQTLADIEDGTVATGAIQAVAAIDSDVTAVAGIAANVTSVAGITADVTAVAGITANVTTVAGIAADITTVAGIAADVTAAANNIPKANRTAVIAPTVNDDSGDGYSEGSLWVDTATNTIYFCADPAAGAAVWQPVAGSASGTSYNNSTSGLTATNVQDAIDEVEGRLETVEGVASTALQSGDIGSQAEIEAETSGALLDGANAKYHPGIAKAWVKFDQTGTLTVSASHNVTSVSDDGTGLFTVNIDTNFSGANYSASVYAGALNGEGNNLWTVSQQNIQSNPTAGAFSSCTWTQANSPADCSIVSLTFYGDQ